MRRDGAGRRRRSAATVSGVIPAGSATELPGSDLVAKGTRDLGRGFESLEALVVSIGAPRLRRLGVAVNRPIPRAEELRRDRAAALPLSGDRSSRFQAARGGGRRGLVGPRRRARSSLSVSIASRQAASPAWQCGRKRRSRRRSPRCAQSWRARISSSVRRISGSCMRSFSRPAASFDRITSASEATWTVNASPSSTDSASRRRSS